jgi:hypothetical protein
MRMSALRLVIVILAVSGVVGCSNGVPIGPPSASALANPIAPSAAAPAAATPAAATPATTPSTTPATTPAATPAQKIAYAPDLQPIFNTDCTPCHSGNRPAGNYSMSSYSNVMRAVRVGSPSSALVLVTQRNGIMYPFFSGDRAAKSAMVAEWVVTDGAAQSR